MPLGALRVSPLKRAMQTLQPTANRVGLRPQVWADCFELGGIYSQLEGTSNRGLTRAQMQELFPSYDLPEDVTDAGWYMLDGKETLEQGRQRAQACAQRLRHLAQQK